MCKITFNKNRDKFNSILKNFSSGLNLEGFHFDLVQRLIEVRCDLEKPNFEVFLTSNSTRFLWVKQVYIYMVYHYKEPELLKRDLELLCFLLHLDQRDRTKISLEVKFAPIHSKYSSDEQLQEGLAKDFIYDKSMPLDMLYVCCAMVIFGNTILLKTLNEGQLEFLYNDGKDIIKKLFPNDLLKEGQWQDLFGKVETCGDLEEVLDESPKKEEEDIRKKLRIVKGKLEKIEPEEVPKTIETPIAEDLPKVVEVLDTPVKETVQEKAPKPILMKDVDVFLDLDKSKSKTISIGMFLVFSLIGFLMGSTIIGLLGGVIIAIILYPLYMERVSLSFQAERLNLKIDDETTVIDYQEVLRVEKKLGDKLEIIFKDTNLRSVQIFESNESYKNLINRVNDSILSNCLVEVNG